MVLFASLKVGILNSSFYNVYVVLSTLGQQKSPFEGSRNYMNCLLSALYLVDFCGLRLFIMAYKHTQVINYK